MGAVTVADLQPWQLFAYLPAADLVRLAHIAEQRAFPAGAAIFAEGDPADAFWVVLKGQVKICKLGAEGREQILRLVHPGESFGEAAALSQGAYPAHGQAIARTTALRFPAAAFQELLRDSPALATNLIVALSQLLLGFAGLVDALALREVSARVAKYLLDLSLRLGSDSIALDVNKRALAARLGTVPETLSRTLRRFREDGLLTVDGARIQILDRTRLEQAAAGMRA
jgi:CRP/FNR family transcriptional regulator, dissimilatory nitrate respiration regulator